MLTRQFGKFGAGLIPSAPWHAMHMADFVLPASMSPAAKAVPNRARLAMEAINVSSFLSSDCGGGHPDRHLCRTGPDDRGISTSGWRRMRPRCYIGLTETAVIAFIVALSRT